MPRLFWKLFFSLWVSIMGFVVLTAWINATLSRQDIPDPPEVAFARSIDKSEQMIGSLAGAFAFIAIFIACLGLFGLASYTAEQRTREIGIRKVLGASVPSVVTLLSREFMILVGIAFVIGAPVAWILMSRWLDMFAFRTEMGYGIIALTAFLTVTIAWLTVSYQAFRSALANPVNAIRSE